MRGNAKNWESRCSHEICWSCTKEARLTTAFFLSLSLPPFSYMPPSSPASSESNSFKAPASPARVYRLPFKTVNKSDVATRPNSTSPSTTKQASGAGVSKAKGKKPTRTAPKQQSLLSTLRTIKKDVDGKKEASSNKKELDRRDLLKRSYSAQSPLDVIGKAWLNIPMERPEKKEIVRVACMS